MQPISTIIEAAANEADALGLAPGSNDRLGYIFACMIRDTCDPQEGVVLWERIAGMSIREIVDSANDLQKQAFKNTFGLSVEDAFAATNKLRHQLKVVR